MGDEDDRDGEGLRDRVDDHLTNWREYRGSLPRKLGLLVRNRAKAYTVGLGCCGHPGEPGC